jgi:flagellar motility protein MotE (MotC chaperone)
MKSFRNIRIIPIAAVAAASLATLMIADLVMDGGTLFDDQPQPGVSATEAATRPATKPATKPSWAQSMLNYPGGPKPAPADITGALPDKTQEKPKQQAKADAPRLTPPDTEPDGLMVYPGKAAQPVSPAERAVLERLKARREQLDQRAREIDIRENLLKEAEKRIEAKVAEVKAIQTQISAAKTQKKEAREARLKGLVTTYENMKPKDAAKVFDHLEMPVLIQIAARIKPRNMSDILGLMSPDAAERLTVELARRANGDASSAPANLPKIEGRILPHKAD